MAAFSFMTERDLIIQIIKDDLINYKLVMGLNKLGLVGEQYFLNASETVFKLMGIKPTKDRDLLYERYEKLKSLVLRCNLEKKPEKLDEIADKIYRELRYGIVLQEAKSNVSL